VRVNNPHHNFPYTQLQTDLGKVTAEPIHLYAACCGLCINGLFDWPTLCSHR